MFQDPNAILVLAGSMLLALCSGLVGSFTLLRKRALVGDAVAHSILPGVCLAFMISGTKSMIWLLPGALLAGWAALLSMDVIVRKTKLKTDAATAIILSVFFAFGIFLLTIIQKSGEGAQSGLDQFLFGKAAAMLPEDVAVFSIVAILIILTITAFFRPLAIVSFNPEFGKSIGMKVGAYEFLLSTMTVLAVSAGIQAVGVVLMAALLITPAAAARIWTDRFVLMMLISSAIAVFSALAGTWVSYQSPGMPTGPWIIMFLSVIAVGSVFLAPKRGMAARWLAARNNSRKIIRENVLKHIYQICEKANDFKMLFNAEQIEGLKYMGDKRRIQILGKLYKSDMLRRENQLWGLTEKGLAESMRIVRLHRLWEMYLNQKLNLKPDHVHEGAEAMEHLITPELEELLKKDLGHPEHDPHNSVIPYPQQR